MWFQVNPRSPLPMYQQVVDAVKAAVAKGMLKPGDRLPPVRELAVHLTINHNTAAKAYQELERDHVIEVVRGRGTFITMHPSVPNAAARTHELRDAIARWVVDAHHLQISDAQLLAMVKEVMNATHVHGKEVEDRDHDG